MADEFLPLIEKHKDELYAYIYRNVWDSSLADDVFSSAVLAAYKSKDNFKIGTNFRAWMYRIVTNKCFVANREVSRRGADVDEVYEEIDGLVSSPEFMEDSGSADDFLAQCGDEIQIAMRKLSTMERSCLLLKVMQNFSYKEIASILEIPFGTVMTHLSRGRAKLRKELMEYARSTGIVTEKWDKKTTARETGITEFKRSVNE